MGVCRLYNNYHITYSRLVCFCFAGEKLDNVERRLDEMNVDLKQTDKNIRELESTCGCCYCPCGKPRTVQVIL